MNRSHAETSASLPALGPLGRVAYSCATNVKRTTIVWVLVCCALGAFLPQLEHSLAGSGMWATGSDSVKARDAVQAANPLASSAALSVIMHGDRPYAEDPAFRRAARAESRLLSGDSAVSGTLGPRKAGLISADGRTVIVTAGAGASPKQMIRAAERLREQVPKVAGAQYQAYLSGLSAQWADFNKDNRDATLHSETYALPITLLVLALAFGSLMAGGLPLLITVIGLAVTGGTLTILTHLFDISMWALTFTLIFTMALGIDYALFIVMRFREALREHADPAVAAAVTMDTAGRAIAFSGTTVFAAISVCFLMPSPMPRSIALGVMLSVGLVMTVMFTLMPMLMTRLGSRIDAGAMPWRRHQNQQTDNTHDDGLMTRWGAFVWHHPRPLAAAAVLVLIVLALPLGHLRVGIPGDTVLSQDAPARQGAALVQRAFGPQGIAPVTVAVPATDAGRTEAVMRADRNIFNALGFLILLGIGIGSAGPVWVLFAATLPIGLGLGLGMAMVPCTQAIIRNVSEAKQGVAASVNHTTRELGTSLGVALFGGLLSGKYTSDMLGITEQLPGPARDASRGSAAGALEVASRLGPNGQALADKARDSYVQATQHTSLVMVFIMLAAGIVAALWAPPKDAAVVLAASAPREVELHEASAVA